MSKQGNNATTESVSPKKASPVLPTPVDFVLTADVQAGNGTVRVGEVVATVQMKLGLPPEFLTDAIRNNFARQV